MQFNLIAAFTVFIGSYLPLALILAVQDIPFSWWSRPICKFDDISNCEFIPFTNMWIAIVFIVITLLSVFFSNLTLAKISYPFKVKVKSSKGIPNDIINYVFLTLFRLWELAMIHLKSYLVLRCSYCGCLPSHISLAR